MHGQGVTVTASGFGPGEQAEVTVHSTPRLLGTAAASTSGVVSYRFVVPTDLPSGSHTLVLRGSTRTSLFAFRLAGSEQVVQASPAPPPAAAKASGSTLPFTGSNTTRLLLIALLLAWAGTMLMLYVGPPRAGAGRHTRNGRHCR